MSSTYSANSKKLLGSAEPNATSNDFETISLIRNLEDASLDVFCMLKHTAL
jgi:hypothetical protein